MGQFPRVTALDGVFLLRIGDGSLFPLSFKVLNPWKFSSKFALEKSYC